MPEPTTKEGASAEQEKQCRICLDGEDPALGRLIRPCLCRGSISYVHVKCLHRWRTSSPSRSAFFSCPQCHYRYHFARTSVVGLATNPVIVGTLSSILFTILVLCSSYVSTYFMSWFDTSSSYGFSYYYYYSGWPLEVGQDLIRAAFRIMQDIIGLDISDDALFLRATNADRRSTSTGRAAPPGFIERFVRRFLLGLPVVGAGSLVHMLLSMPLLGPVHWIARYRSSRRNRSSNVQDVATILIIVLIVVGAARALYKVYQLTQRLTQRVLIRAEDVILEVR